MAKINKTLILLLMLVLTASCVDEIHLPTGTDFKPEVVIDGSIRPDTISQIYVFKTAPFDGDYRFMNPLEDAEVRIISDKGYVSELGKLKNYGEDNKKESYFELDVRPVDPHALYSVEVKVDGEVYRSDFQKVLFTPETSGIIFDEQKKGINIAIRSSSSECRYFMWNYEEYWQYLRKTVNKRPVSQSDPSLYVQTTTFKWIMKNFSSSNIMLYSIMSQNTDRVEGKSLLHFGQETNRFLSLYGIEITQRALSREAYEYFETMKRLVEESNSVYSLLPSDMRGNVRCVSNPKIGARGMVIASSEQTTRALVYAKDLKHYKGKEIEEYKESGSAGGRPSFWPADQPPEDPAPVVYKNF